MDQNTVGPNLPDRQGGARGNQGRTETATVYTVTHTRAGSVPALV
jgi:hypothetical protein